MGIFCSGSSSSKTAASAGFMSFTKLAISGYLRTSNSSKIFSFMGCTSSKVLGGKIQHKTKSTAANRAHAQDPKPEAYMKGHRQQRDLIFAGCIVRMAALSPPGSVLPLLRGTITLLTSFIRYISSVSTQNGHLYYCTCFPCICQDKREPAEC